MSPGQRERMWALVPFAALLVAILGILIWLTGCTQTRVGPSPGGVEAIEAALIAADPDDMVTRTELALRLREAREMEQ